MQEVNMESELQSPLFPENVTYSVTQNIPTSTGSSLPKPPIKNRGWRQAIPTTIEDLP